MILMRGCSCEAGTQQIVDVDDALNHIGLIDHE
jgi:hypothetical protein